MDITTLKTLVLKTVTVSSVKLTTPADRIGLGFGDDLVAVYPADVLSPGQFPLPHNPGLETGLGNRQDPSAMRLHPQAQAMATAEPPAGRVGSSSVPGSSAQRGASRASFPAVFGVHNRFGGDCQSPDRRDDRKPACAWRSSSEFRRLRETTPATAAGL